MDSLYAAYLKERTHDSIIEADEGFASYRYVNDYKSVYIVDIYVTKSARNRGLAKELADQIVKKAHGLGCTELIGTVCPSANGSTESIKVLLAYGMTLQSASQDCIVFRKDI